VPKPQPSIRVGDDRDVPTVLRLFDEAVAWLVARGQTGQWGDRPFSERPQNVEHAREWAGGGGLRVAELDGETVGFVVLGEAYPWVTPADEPEIYLQALVTSRAHAGRDVGGALVRAALEEARERAIRLVRVDCWAGAPRLVEWYEEQGFTRTETFTVGFGPAGDWTGQVFERRL
jgi:ribosomal protein S18 acetylase RimI-like enzyme